MKSAKLHSSLFVGRKTELASLSSALCRPQGEAMLIFGPSGIGKTYLARRFANLAERNPALKCGAVYYATYGFQSVESLLEQMQIDIYKAASIPEGSFAQSEKRLKQWKALLGVIPKGKELVELCEALRPEKKMDPVQAFIERLHLISDKMPQNGRMVFIVDSEKYMKPYNRDAWCTIISALPTKVKIVFAQRPEDALVSDPEFVSLPNVLKIPDEGLGPLNEEAVDNLIELHPAINSLSADEIREAIRRYQCHPYAVRAALDLILSGCKVSDLPNDPTPLNHAKTQWAQVYRTKSEKAVALLKAYSQLRVHVPDEIAAAVAGIKPEQIEFVRRSEPIVNGLLSDRPEGTSIYHCLLMDHIRYSLRQSERKEISIRSVEAYRKLLHSESRPHELAARELVHHAYEAGGPGLFIEVLLSESVKPLIDLGYLHEAITQLNRALKMKQANPMHKSRCFRYLGAALYLSGNHREAEKRLLDALKIAERIPWEEGMADAAGNLGVLYWDLDRLEDAKAMHLRSLEIETRLGRPHGVAADLGNLGLIYLKTSEFKLAEESFLAALQKNIELGRQDGIACQYENLGKLYHKVSKPNKALQMFNKALEVEKILGRAEGIARNYRSMGDVYLESGQINQARKIWREAIVMYRRGQMKAMEIDLLERLRKLDDKMASSNEISRKS